MTLSAAFGPKFTEHQESLRTRTFKLGNHTFKVKVPLTVETEAMFERVKAVDEEKAEKYYQEMAKEFLENRERYAKDSEVEYTENDVLVRKVSIRETTKNKILTENRILESFKLLVPESKDFDMSKITYPEIEELFPFPVQLEMLEQINQAISPAYSSAKGK